MEESEQVKRKEFLTYEMIRMSGATNMVAVTKVIELSHKYCETKLTKEVVMNCLKNYGFYSNKWLDKKTIDEIRAELTATDMGADSDSDGYDYNNADKIQQLRDRSYDFI